MRIPQCGTASVAAPPFAGFASERLVFGSAQSASAATRIAASGQELCNVSKRIFAQQGMFTIHRADRTAIEDISEAQLVKLVVPRQATTSIKLDLRLAGIGETTVFPDLEGLAREINFRIVVDRFGALPAEWVDEPRDARM